MRILEITPKDLLLEMTKKEALAIWIALDHLRTFYERAGEDEAVGRLTHMLTIIDNFGFDKLTRAPKNARI